MKILIAGDFCDKYRVSEQIQKGNFASMFDDVKPVISQADFSIVNFEFPIVESEGRPILKCGPNLKGQKASIDAIKYAGFNVCTLANNHILDQGEECCLNTKRLLETSGIKTVGASDSLHDAGAVLYLEKVGETLAIINCCEHEFSIATDHSAGANPLNPIQQYYKIQEAKSKADYVVVIVHGGHEHYQLPSPRMKETYRFFIDAGASAVVNHHQHCFSGYEIYRGKPIFYGLGNFCFDAITPKSDIWYEGYMVALQFDNAKLTFDLLPYLQCKGNTQVHLINDTEDFNKKITSLNAIIASENELNNSFNKHCDFCSNKYDWTLEPYSSSFLKRLYVKGILPKLYCKEKKFALENFIHCESHREEFIYHLMKNRHNNEKKR